MHLGQGTGISYFMIAGEKFGVGRKMYFACQSSLRNFHSATDHCQGLSVETIFLTDCPGGKESASEHHVTG